MCYFNRLTRVACWLADYPEWLQFCWDFVKSPRNDEIALPIFFSCLQQCKNLFFYFICAACIFFLPTSVKWPAPNSSLFFRLSRVYIFSLQFIKSRITFNLDRCTFVLCDTKNR